MEAILIGFITLVVVVGGALTLAGAIQLVKAPFRNR
jgi:hypothetical protein